MAFVGSLFIAVVVYFLGTLQYTLYGHLFSLGCILLGCIAWFSTKSGFGGLLATVIALVLLSMGILTAQTIAIIAALWVVIAWGIK